MRMKMFNFLREIAKNCKFWSQKRQSFSDLILSDHFYFDLYNISEDIRESLRLCWRFLLFFEIQRFLEKKPGVCI